MNPETENALSRKNYRDRTLKAILQRLGNCGYKAASITDDRFDAFVNTLNSAIDVLNGKEVTL